MWSKCLRRFSTHHPRPPRPALSLESLLRVYSWRRRENLKELARRTGTDRFAKELLHARLLRRRLLAIVTLGHLQERSIWNELAAALQADNAFVLLVAAKALLHIDAKAAVPLIIPVISQRKDWSRSKSWRSSNRQVRTSPLRPSRRLRALPARKSASRLIRHLAATQSQHALPPLRDMLQKGTPSDDLLAACLFLFGECSDPRDIVTIRTHLSHPTWYVRLQAASALGKVGIEEDEARLIALLDDEHWWVRYRAAEALSNLPWMTTGRLTRVHNTLTTVESQEHLVPLWLNRMRRLSIRLVSPSA